MTSVHTRSNPSPRYIELGRLYRQIHDVGLSYKPKNPERVFAGNSLQDHISDVRSLVKDTGAKSILDYGSGKGRLYGERDLQLEEGTVIPSIKQYWGVDLIQCFDPGVPEFLTLPTTPFDGVICTDVLEHIPEEDIPWVLREMFSLATHFVYANVAAYPARKILPNGWNAHVTTRRPSWWRGQIRAAAAASDDSRYEFLIQRHRRMPTFIRKRLGLPKLKTTRIERKPALREA